MADWKDAYWSQGYAILRGVFGPEDVAALRRAFDAVLAEAARHSATTRAGLTEYRILPVNGKPALKFAKWASAAHPLLDSYRMDPRLLGPVRALLGDDLRQVTNQMHYKNPGDGVSFQFHQDCSFRKPDASYRDLYHSFLQTGIAVDPSTQENGCLRFIPKSHLPGRDLGLGGYEGEEADARNAAVLAAFPPPVEALMEPGDLALWNPFTVHGSLPNRSPGPRRVYINGFARAQDCDHGVEVLRAGQAVPLAWGPDTRWDQVEER